MNVKELLEKQKNLDDFILKEININYKDRLNSSILALVVEIGEMANEIRSHKYWSKKAPSPKEVVLDEFVDCLHFILSIANQLGFSEKDIEEAYDKKNAVNFERQRSGY